uniref:Uncharacterized protein n=2 Tax=Rhinopithecus TaxID=542827 RepID=A0A2K6MX55_RHIBE
TLLKVRRASLKPLAAPHQGAFRAGNVIELIYLLTWSLFTACLQPLTLLQGPRTSPQGSPPQPPWGDYAEPSCLCEMKIRRQRHEGPAWGRSGFLAEGLHLAPSSLSPAACRVVRMKGPWGRGAGIRRRR